MVVHSDQSSQQLPLISKCRVYPAVKSTLGNLQLTVSDLPMLSCHYIQKGVLFPTPPFPIPKLISLLKSTLSLTLSHFPPLAGRLTTDADGVVHISCNDSGADLLHADGSHLLASDLASTGAGDSVTPCFALDGTVSYGGHSRPILAVQITQLSGGVFIGCSVNHAVADGTSFWNFFNTFAEITRGEKIISRTPDFTRRSILISPAVLELPEGGPEITFSGDSPVSERIFRFTRESISKLKARVNENDGFAVVRFPERRVTAPAPSPEISSFQSLCALLWRGITRARKFPGTKMTTFRMAVNCRHRLEPKLEPMYFGNAIQSIPTFAAAGEVLGNEIRWCAERLNRNVAAYGDGAVRRYVEEWERDPRCFPLGNFDGAMITMGSSPRFPMYENDFGWGRPVAVRSGRGNKFDGKISAFPGREGGGTVDLEVLLAPETMAGLESDPEFMQYVSLC